MAPGGPGQRQNAPSPITMPSAESQSRPCTRCGSCTAITPKTITSSVAMSGCTTDRLPTRRASTWNTKPRIMLAMPTNHAGRLSR